MNIPNLLSIFRLCLIPVFLLVLFSGIPYSTAWACAVFLFSGMTDVLDGYIARKYNMVTAVGKVLDPLADKLMQITVFISLLVKDIIPAWIVIIFATKECLMILGSTYIIKNKIKIVEAKWYGKLCTVVFYAVVVLFMLVPELHPIVKNISLVVVLVLTVMTITLYAVDTLKAMKKNKYEFENKNSSSV